MSQSIEDVIPSHHDYVNSDDDDDAFLAMEIIRLQKELQEQEMLLVQQHKQDDDEMIPDDDKHNFHGTIDEMANDPNQDHHISSNHDDANVTMMNSVQLVRENSQLDFIDTSARYKYTESDDEDDVSGMGNGGHGRGGNTMISYDEITIDTTEFILHNDNNNDNNEVVTKEASMRSNKTDMTTDEKGRNNSHNDNNTYHQRPMVQSKVSLSNLLQNQRNIPPRTKSFDPYQFNNNHHNDHIINTTEIEYDTEYNNDDTKSYVSYDEITVTTADLLDEMNHIQEEVEEDEEQQPPPQYTNNVSMNENMSTNDDDVSTLLHIVNEQLSTSNTTNMNDIETDDISYHDNENSHHTTISPMSKTKHSETTALKESALRPLSDVPVIQKISNDDSAVLDNSNNNDESDGMVVTLKTDTNNICLDTNYAITSNDHDTAIVVECNTIKEVVPTEEGTMTQNSYQSIDDEIRKMQQEILCSSPIRSSPVRSMTTKTVKNIESENIPAQVATIHHQQSPEMVHTPQKILVPPSVPIVAETSTNRSLVGNGKDVNQMIASPKQIPSDVTTSTETSSSNTIKPSSIWKSPTQKQDGILNTIKTNIIIKSPNKVTSPKQSMVSPNKVISPNKVTSPKQSKVSPKVKTSPRISSSEASSSSSLSTTPKKKKSPKKQEIASPKSTHQQEMAKTTKLPSIPVSPLPHMSQGVTTISSTKLEDRTTATPSDEVNSTSTMATSVSIVDVSTSNIENGGNVVPEENETKTDKKEKKTKTVKVRKVRKKVSKNTNEASTETNVSKQGILVNMDMIERKHLPANVLSDLAGKQNSNKESITEPASVYEDDEAKKLQAEIDRMQAQIEAMTAGISKSTTTTSNTKNNSCTRTNDGGKKQETEQSKVVTRPPMFNLLGAIEQAATQRVQRLEETGGTLIMQDIVPEITIQESNQPRQLSTSMAEMISQRASARDKRLADGGEKRMRKVQIKEKDEYKRDFSSIVGDVAAMGRLTRLNEYTVEAVAQPKKAKEEWKSNGLLAIQWKSSHMSVIHEAAAAGNACKMPEYTVSNFDDMAELEQYYDASKQPMNSRMQRLLELDARVGEGLRKVDNYIDGRKEQQGKLNSLLIKPMQSYNNISDVKLPRQSAPKIDPAKNAAKLSKMKREALMSGRPMVDISSYVAEVAWERRARLDRPGSLPKVREVCPCPYCISASPYQTYAYRELERQQKDGILKHHQAQLEQHNEQYGTIMDHHHVDDSIMNKHDTEHDNNNTISTTETTDEIERKRLERKRIREERRKLKEAVAEAEAAVAKAIADVEAAKCKHNDIPIEQQYDDKKSSSSLVYDVDDVDVEAVGALQEAAPVSYQSSTNTSKLNDRISAFNNNNNNTSTTTNNARSKYKNQPPLDHNVGCKCTIM